MKHNIIVMDGEPQGTTWPPNATEEGLTRSDNCGYRWLVAEREDGKFVLATPHKIILVADTEDVAAAAGVLLFD